MKKGKRSTKKPRKKAAPIKYPLRRNAKGRLIDAAGRFVSPLKVHYSQTPPATPPKTDAETAAEEITIALEILAQRIRDLGVSTYVMSHINEDNTVDASLVLTDFPYAPSEIIYDVGEFDSFIPGTSCSFVMERMPLKDSKTPQIDGQIRIGTYWTRADKAPNVNNSAFIFSDIETNMVRSGQNPSQAISLFVHWNKDGTIPKGRA